VLYVIWLIYTCTTLAPDNFFALQSSVTSDATDNIGTSPAYRSAIQRRFQTFWSVTGYPFLIMCYMSLFIIFHIF